ncbi:MAG: peptidylprolyl isomerase, partial [Methanobrevibacter sp.]|nr:peptidylprolyl isomerase [Methanobrevibacter sp.]
DEEEKIKSMIELHYSNPNVDIDKTEIDIVDGVANIKLDEMSKFDQQSYMDVTFARFRIAKDIWDNIEEITKVNFVDEFEKREESDDEEDEE